MTKRKSGFAFHVRHDVLIEWCYDCDERVRTIKRDKPIKEQELRLRLFQLIPQDRLPVKLNKAWEAYDKTRKAYDKTREACIKTGEACTKAWKAYDKAWKAYDKAGEACTKAGEACTKAGEACNKEIEILHQELCPNCPWNGQTIFSKAEGREK